jgi:hypothetical protein
MSNSDRSPGSFFNSPHPQEDAALFGNIILLWSRVEMALLNILLRLTSPPFKFKADPFPQALAARLKLTKRGYTEIPAMASLKYQALPLLDTLASLRRQRHLIVHGYYQGFTGYDKYLFTTYKREKEKGTFEFHDFTHDQVLSLTRGIEAALKSTEALSKETFLVPFPLIKRDID